MPFDVFYSERSHVSSVMVMNLLVFIFPEKGCYFLCLASLFLLFYSLILLFQLFNIHLHFIILQNKYYQPSTIYKEFVLVANTTGNKIVTPGIYFLVEEEKW